MIPSQPSSLDPSCSFGDICPGASTAAEGPRSQPVAKPGIGSIEENQARPKGGRPWRLAPWKRLQVPLPGSVAWREPVLQYQRCCPRLKILGHSGTDLRGHSPGTWREGPHPKDPTCRASPQHPRWALTMCPFSAPNPQSMPQDSAPAGQAPAYLCGFPGPVSVFFQIHTFLRVKHYCAVREGLLAALQTSLFSNSSPSCHHSHHSPSKRYFQASLMHHKLMFAEPATFTSGSSEETPPRFRVLKWDLSDNLVSTPTPQPHFT
nr:uncharacterized protein LOC131757289 [Kogia breviceps]XP_058920613.1 uncharacterized protein LOC131757289 [Kogia breviceps]XP_058920614.1 uncharacterized protein LOC131757289 [Kogia breviceps]